MIKNKNKIPMAASTALRNRPVIEPSKKNDDGNTLRFDSRSARKLIPLERNPADETEEAYLLRLGMKMDKSKIPAVLASSPDPFHSSALTKYMSLFEFSHDPIDISIRKLLMVVDLPSETQQIDRVIESFSRRYTECNRKLFPSSDKVYILAFSIIMLHTDSFNKSNKVKMSRADYVRNTKMNGIPTEVLEYVYDNVTYTPFVYVDPDRNICGQNITRQSQPANDNTGSSFLSLGGNNNNLASTLPSSNILPGTKDSRSKLDPYQLIAQGCTHELRLGLGAIIPSRNPFSFMGSANLFNFKHPRESFNPAKAVIIQVVNLAPSKTPSIFRQIEIDDSLDPGNYCQEHSPSACQSPLKRTAEDGSRNESKAVSSATTSPFTASSFLNLRAIKVGLVHLKVDTYTTFTSTQSTSSQNCTSEVSMIKNAISKKWKRFCLLLTARQLILIKDAGLAAELQESIKLAGFVNQANPEDRLVVRITGLKPELVLSLEGAIALSDSTYQRRPSTFRLILSKNLSLLVGVDDDDDMNSWIAHINYAATYKTQRLPYLPSNQFMSSPHPSMSMSPSTMANHHKKYLRTARSNDLNSRNEMISISLPSSPSFSTRITNHHPQDTAEVSYGKPIVSPTMASRSTPISISCSAGPSDLGPSFMGGRPRSNSFHFPPPLRSSSTTLHPSTHWDRVNAQMSLLEAQIVAAKSELNEDLRLARNLALLTPFQHSTRLRLQQSIRPLAHRVRSSRCQLSKLICYREVLACDFAHFTAAMKGVNSPTIDFEPNPGSTSQPRKGGRRCVDQPQESLFQNSKLPSQDEQHSRRRTSPKAVGRSSSTRKALDVLVGRQACNTGRGNTWADEPPLVRRSSLPAARIKRIRSSIGGSSPNHTSSHATAGALDSLKDSGIKRPVVEIISRGDSSLERKPRLSPPTPSTMLPACQPSLTKGTESARPMTKGDSSAQPVSCEDGDEVLEGMASLRKVGRHASEQWRPLAATLKLVQEQEEQDGATSGRLAGSGAMMRSLSLYRSGRRGSGTPTSARSLAAKSGTVSTDGDRRTSDSPRSSLKAPFLPASLAHRDSLTSSPSSSATHTSSLANPSLLQPPEASPLHSSSARRPSSCPTVSSSATTATQRAAARARMFSKAKLIAAQARSSFLFPASFLPPEQSSSVVVPIAASSGGAANLHPHCLPPADPQPSSSLLPTVPSSPTPDSDSDSSGSVIPVGNAARAPPPPSGYAKRFTYAWGLP